MPRKIGYGNFTPARKAALRKAQLESARKRRKHHFDEHKSRRRRKQIAATAAVGAAAIAAGAFAYNKNQNNKLGKQNKRDVEDAKSFYKNEPSTSSPKRSYQELLDAAGPLHQVCESQEQWDARIELFGEQGVLGEISPIHKRPEIFPTMPVDVVTYEQQIEAMNPTWSLMQEMGDGDFLTLYHRTGGGSDLDAEKAAESILKNQSMQILNRDERRAAKINPAVQFTVQNQFHWFSTRLNDSNTRAAFGETVLKIDIPRKFVETYQISGAGFGPKISPNKEMWAGVPAHIMTEILKEAKFERVPPEMITPMPERKFRAPR